jgi:hypothetical protein
VLSGGSTSAFLVGRLTQEGRTPLAVLTAAPGRRRTLSQAHVFAVTEGLLWLAQPRLLGGPAMASIGLDQVGPVIVDAAGSARGAVRVDIPVSGRHLIYTVLDDADAARSFASAVEVARGAA